MFLRRLLKAGRALLSYSGGLALCMVSGSAAWSADWQPVPDTMRTRWAGEVGPANALPEYPRPTMVRPEWMNLNGLWEYCIYPTAKGHPKDFDGNILVPFAVESALSGVGREVRPEHTLWYRRGFTVPESWRGKRVLMHFGAVDHRLEPWLNGNSLGVHYGGYDAVTYDITDHLNYDSGNLIGMLTSDPTDAGAQAHGKQVLASHGMYFNAVSGIWQTVWLEVVPAAGNIDALVNTPDLDASRLTVEVTCYNAQAGDMVRAVAISGTDEVATDQVPVGEPVVLEIPEFRAWSPSDPYLYDLRVELVRGGAVIDTVGSYFGMRKISLMPDENGIPRLALNNEILFQYGVLDQGYWPDGLYTAPTDEALRYDIEVARDLGFNMIRKHMKIEPERWYYWCDRLGMLVWQDMPSGGGWVGSLNAGPFDVERTEEDKKQFETELRRMVEQRRNHTSVVMWVPFNEGWGQYDTERITQMVAELDPSRLINSASGWHDRFVGDVRDSHQYPLPVLATPEGERAVVCGEFGGMWYPMPGHYWGHVDADMPVQDPENLTLRYLSLCAQIPHMRARWLSAAVYTEITDQQYEAAGLLTFDRAVIKVDAERVRAAHAEFYGDSNADAILPTAFEASLTWHYTTENPGIGWQEAGFDDASWKTGEAGFGNPENPRAPVRTAWTSEDIWLRRSVRHGEQLHYPALYLMHDDEVEVYVDGRPIAEREGWKWWYEVEPLDALAADAFSKPEAVIAVHCHQVGGDQYIDVGLGDTMPGDAWGETLLGDAWQFYGWPGGFLLSDDGLTLGAQTSFPIPAAERRGDKALLREADWLDVRISTRLRFEPGAETDAGILFRASDADLGLDAHKGLYAALSPHGEGSVFLGRMDGEGYTHLEGAAWPVRVGKWYTLEVEAIGDEIVVSVDGQAVFRTTGSTLARGSCGVRTVSGPVTFADFEAGPPEEEARSWSFQ